MHPTKLQGIIPPMITPLKGDDELDREGTVRLTEHLVAGGVHAIFLLGTTGEAQSLTYRLRYEFVELVCRQVAGRIPVLVGVTDTAFIESVRLAEHAAKCGAVGVVAAPPYYFAPSQQELIEYYSQVDEPTIICIFGDHQPSVESAFYEELFGKPTSELTLEEEQKMYVTPFMIWANYDIEEKTVEDISLNYLATLLLETAELPMTAYQQYLTELHKTLPVITTLGYMDAEGSWYRMDDEDSPYAELVENYRKVQYNNLLDKRNRVNSLFLLPERT